MSTLRVLLADAPAPDRAAAWAFFGTDGALQSVGCDRPDAWPRADCCEAVLSSSRARIAVVALPPLPAARLQAAAAFAIEDQLAGPVDAASLIATAQGADGHVRIVVVDKALLQLIAGIPPAPGVTPRFSRVIAEVDLVATTSQLHWCIDEQYPAQAFVRAPDGSAYPTSGLDDDLLPPELTLMLARLPATNGGVSVHGSVNSAQLARWSAATGASFSAAPPWRWYDAPAIAFGAATELLPQQPVRHATTSATMRWLTLRPAALIAAAALALHVVATTAEWGWLRIDAWRDAQAWSKLVSSAGIAADAVQGTAAARTTLLRQYAELRHANGAAAPDDALPLLARAAPALARLPAGALKSASFVDGTWTLELGPVDAAILRQLDDGMKAADLPALRATTSAGTRARFGSR